MGLFTVDFCPGDQGLHQVSHHQKVNVPAIPKEGEGGVSNDSCIIRL